MGDMSVREFYAHPVRWIAEAIGKESVFEKPYLDEDRAKMHLDFPWPDWPSMPDIPPWPPVPPFEGPKLGLPGCAILCYPPYADCEDPIWCHPGIWCGTDIGCTLCTWVVEGAVKGYTPHGSGVGSWGIDIWIDDELVEAGGEALVNVCMTDPCGNVCCQDIEVTCKVCPPEVVMTWDAANSADTVARSASAGVAVQDGVGPYTWSVAGTGFTMQHAQTDGVLNSVVADGTACGTATVTVTDYCEDTTTGYVRCTIGQWVQKSAGSCVVPGTGTFTSEVDPHCRYEYIIDNKNQIQWTRYCGSCTGDGCCDPYCTNDTYCVNGNACANCIDPFTHDCWNYDQFPHGYLSGGKWYCFCPGYFQYNEWEC